MARPYENTGDTIIRRPEVCQRTGLSRSTVYARVKEGKFPAPISLGGKAVGWSASEVDAWIVARIAEPRALAPQVG